MDCDLHRHYLQIAMAEDSAGELLLERRLAHESGDAHPFHPPQTLCSHDWGMRGSLIAWRLARPPTSPSHLDKKLQADGMPSPERNLGAERVKATLRNARAKCKHFGRPKVAVHAPRFAAMCAQERSRREITMEKWTSKGNAQRAVCSLPTIK
jgi:hypothetical protein